MDGRSEPPNRVRLTLSVVLSSFALACLMAAMLETLTRQTPLLRSFEHWASDWRAALLADRLPGQHPRIALVVADDDTVEGLPYRSPLDRAILARAIDALAEAGADVVALDFIFDQPTEPDKDAMLARAIAKARDRVVLATVDSRVAMRGQRREWHERFLADAGAAFGTVNLRTEIDGVVRAEAEPSPAPEDEQRRESFAMTIARAAGAPAAGVAPRIAWLGKPRDGSDTFLTIPLGAVAAPRDDDERRVGQLLLADVRNRVVLVGGDFTDQADRHTIPLSRLEGGPVAGVVIHAHAVAQLVDGRRLHNLAPPLEAGLVLAMSLGGILAGWLYGTRSSILRKTLPLVVLMGVDIMLFAGYRTVLPFAGPVIAWVAGMFVGRGAGWLVGRLEI